MHLDSSRKCQICLNHVLVVMRDLNFNEGTVACLFIDKVHTHTHTHTQRRVHTHTQTIVGACELFISFVLQVPSCQKCGGILKPEIVFFGDSVPKPTVNFVFERLAESDAVLVVGSSLEVMLECFP